MWDLWVLQQCERFSCLPEQLFAQDTELMRMLAVEAEVKD